MREHTFIFWGVQVLRYTSQEAKKQAEKGAWDWKQEYPVVSTRYYGGWGERWASVQFYRACRDALQDELVIKVIMTRDSLELMACVVPDRMFKLIS